MPKKIKQAKDTVLKGNKEPLINVNNIHIVFIAITVLILCICVGVGIYAYLEDKSHPNKENALVQFTYTENNGEGFIVYDMRETDTKQVFTEYNTLDVMDVNEISRSKYLDFNEEIYNSGFLELMEDEEREASDEKWQLYIKFSDGTRKYAYSSTLDNEENSSIDKQLLNDIIYRYFKEEIKYK